MTAKEPSKVYRLGRRLDNSSPVLLAADPSQKIGFIGVSGSGKSYAALKLAEQMLIAGDVVCAIDPVGIWWGLRTGRDLDPAWGLDVMIFGGMREDHPLPDAREAARYVVENGVSCVMDVSSLPIPELHEWCALFFQEVMFLGPRRHRMVHFPIEEAPVLAPQSGLGSKWGQDCRNAIVHVARVGRNFGYGMSVISQRAAAVDKNVLTQCSNLLMMRIAASIDRKAIMGWVAENSADIDVDSSLKKLSGAPAGTGLLWAPSWPNNQSVGCRVAIDLRQTYHPHPSDLRRFDDLKLRGILMRERKVSMWEALFGLNLKDSEQGSLLP